MARKKKKEAVISQEISLLPLTRDSIIDDLKKSVKPKEFPKDQPKTNNKSKIVFGTRLNQASYGSVEVKGFRRLSDAELKDIAIIDPYISAIIAKRCTQVTAIGRPSESKFDKGTRIKELIPLSLKQFESAKDFETAKFIRNAQAKNILDWTMYCGERDEETLNLIYANSDSDFKHCTFYQFLQAQVRNLLTFGRCATQIIKDSHGIPILFRPVPIETIYRILEGEPVNINRNVDTHPQSINDVEEYNAIEPVKRPFAYVQRVNGQDLNFFTEDELVVWSYQTQAFFDLNGYPLAPIELAVYMVYVHQQTLQYLRNTFVKGMASKGMIVLESTSPSAQISDEDIEDFRQQFHNFITRNENSAVIPVIGGPVKAEFIPLNATPKDLEFLHVEEHVIRALCSAFQISPQEMGYGNLALNAQGNQNKAEEIIYGEETGLRTLLDVIYDGINEIVFSHFKEGAELFSIGYTGVGEDTKDAITNRNVTELNTTATMNSLWADSDKTEPFPYGGDAPICPHFNQFIVPKMMYWEYRMYFLGDKNAKANPSFNFVIDPAMNQSYQQLLITPIAMQQQQANIQFKLQTQQATMQEQQMEQMQMGGDPNQPADAQNAPPEEQQQPEVQQKSLSLKDQYRQLSKSKERMQKSEYASLFEEWVNIH